MIQNPITFVVSNNGTILGGQRGTVRALSNYASKIYFVAPFESVSVKVNYLIYESKREVIGQYLAPTTLKGSQVLATTDPQYQTAAQWTVWEASISQRALHRIAKYRAGRIGVSFEITSITQPSQALSYQGLFGTDQNDVLPSVEASGNYYVCDSYNFTSNEILFTKGDYAYSNGTAWLKGQNIQLVAMTATQDLAVDPSLQAEIPEDISEDAELEALIDQLISDVADLSTDITAHIADLNDPHDTQANQVDGTYRASATDVQSALDDIADELDAIIDGDTDITYDPTADDIIDATTVSGALGQLDDALYEHITDLDNPHQVVASQVNVSHQSQTVSVQTAINDLQADKVEKSPNTITSVSGTDKVYVNDGSEKLITVSNLKTSIVEDLVAFGYVIFTEKDENGQPVIASPQTNKIYLFNPSDSDIENDQYEEWVYIDSAFELIGTTGIQLEDYYDKTETDALIVEAKKLQFYSKVKNTTGSQIPKGSIIQFAGSTGTEVEIKVAVASEVNANPELLMGVAYDNIPIDNNVDGEYVLWFGEITGLNLTGFSDGDILYFDTVNGGFVNQTNIPTTNKIIVAAVIKGGNGGALLVRPKWLSRDIDDVDGLQDALDGKVSKSGDTMTGKLTVNVASGDIQEWQLGGARKVFINGDGNIYAPNGIANINGTTFSLVSTGITGSVISRDRADANPALIVNQVNAGSTGDILKVQAAGTDRLTVTQSGNVGIGTTSPQGKLEVNGGGTVTTGGTLIVRQRGDSGNDGIALTSSNVLSHRIWKDVNGKLNIGTSNTLSAFVQDLSGNIGINQTSPTAQLEVKSSATDKVPLVVDTISGHNNNLQEWKVNSSNRAYIDLNGWYWTGQGIININNSQNARIQVTDDGAVISRNIADANDALTVNLANASSTGLILDAQAAGTTVASIAKDGTVTTPNVVATSTVKIGSWTLSEGATGSLDFTL